MKQKYIYRTMAIVAAALCTLTARAKKPRVIENPECIANSTDNTLTVTRVELSDTATVISFHATYKPGWWICLSRSTVLIDDAGRRYATRCGIGIGLSKRFTMPDSGEADFKVSFEPLPRGTRHIDMIESPQDLKIWGIHERGDKPLSKKATALKPDPALQATDEASFFRRGTGVIRGRFTGKHPAIINYNGYDAIMQTDNPKVFDVADDGTFTATIPVECPTLDYLRFDNSQCYFYLCAGDTIDMTINEDNTVGYADGTRHRRLLTLLSNINPEISLDYQHMKALAGSLTFADYSKAIVSGTKERLVFADYLTSKYGLNPEESHLLRTMTRMRCCWFINEIDMTKPDSTATGSLNPANYTFMRDMGLEDLTCFSLPHELHFLLNRYEFCDMMLHKRKPEFTNQAAMTNDSTKMAVDEAIFGLGHPSKLLQLIWLNEDYYKENIYNIDPEQGSKLIDSRKRLLVSPYLRARLDSLQRKLGNPSAAIYDLPEGRATDIFNAIVKPYRGKMVIVDFWATTCGPCVAEIKESQRLRNSIAAMPDVEFVFITNDRQTSEKSYKDFTAKYLNGEESHRIPYDDWQRLMALFKFNGIPHKEIVTPSGRIADIEPPQLYHGDYALREIRNIVNKLKE